MLDIPSGYDPAASNWKAFLQAWQDTPKKYPDASIFNVLDIQHGTPEEEIAALQERLRLPSLPPSYVDFLRAARVDAARWEMEDYGLYPLEKIDYFQNTEPEWFNILKNKWPIDSPDSDYFVYGAKQDGSHFKSEFLEGFIDIGSYFPTDCLILNSRVQTSDGEFECILRCAAFSVRTLSFAAMMRALCIYECQDVDSYPPYEDSLMNSGIPALITSGH